MTPHIDPRKDNLMRILAIDPGNEESGYAVIESSDCRPLAIGKKENHTFRAMIGDGQFSNIDTVSIEMIGHYGKGMPAGKTVFDTCIWIGRFLELFDVGPVGPGVELVLRATIKAHICGSTAAKDSNISQALIDRFASGVRNRGKGTKSEPGWFFGFRADIWQAYALAVFTADKTASQVA